MFFGICGNRVRNPPQEQTINEHHMIRLRRFFRRNKHKLYVSLSLLSLVNFMVPHPVAAIATTPDDGVVQAAVASEQVVARSGPAPMLPVIPSVPAKRTLRVTATAYTSTVAECDSDPFTTASGAKTADGVIAANGFAFGTRIRIPDYFGDKVFTVLDRMGRGGNRIDIWMTNRHDALEWGVRSVKIEVI